MYLTKSMQIIFGRVINAIFKALFDPRIGNSNPPALWSALKT